MKYLFANEHNCRALCSIKFSHFLKTGFQNRFLLLINNKKEKFFGQNWKEIKKFIKGNQSNEDNWPPASSLEGITNAYKKHTNFDRIFLAYVKFT